MSTPVPYGAYETNGAYVPYGLLLPFPASLRNDPVNPLPHHLAHTAGSPVPPVVQRKLAQLLNLVLVHLEGVADHLTPTGSTSRTSRTGRTGICGCRLVWGSRNVLWREGRG